MKTVILFVTLLILPVAVESGEVSLREKGIPSAAEQRGIIIIGGKATALDRAAHTVAVTPADSKAVTLKAGPKVKLQSLKVGDTIKATHQDGSATSIIIVGGKQARPPR